MLAVRLDPTMGEKLTRLAQETGRSKSYYVKQAISDFLDEREDYRLALAWNAEASEVAGSDLGLSGGRDRSASRSAVQRESPRGRQKGPLALPGGRFPDHLRS